MSTEKLVLKELVPKPYREVSILLVQEKGEHLGVLTKRSKGKTVLVICG
jgi:hypothetical protein